MVKDFIALRVVWPIMMFMLRLFVDHVYKPEKFRRYTVTEAPNYHEDGEIRVHTVGDPAHYTSLAGFTTFDGSRGYVEDMVEAANLGWYITTLLEADRLDKKRKGAV
jgi:hypothetical protein